jgi:hypothetical protein
MRISPTEPGPGDTPAVVPVNTPVPRPGDRRHDIKPMRSAVVAQPVPPRPSAVLHLDPEPVPANFGAQGERAAGPGGAVQDRPKSTPARSSAPAPTGTWTTSTSR